MVGGWFSNTVGQRCCAVRCVPRQSRVHEEDPLLLMHDTHPVLLQQCCVLFSRSLSLFLSLARSPVRLIGPMYFRTLLPVHLHHPRSSTGGIPDIPED